MQVYYSGTIFLKMHMIILSKYDRNKRPISIPFKNGIEI